MALSDDDTNTLIRHLTAKSRSVPDLDIEGLVATCVLDTLLVSEGYLSVDDFAPKEN